jgi:hypothetical protein
VPAVSRLQQILSAAKIGLEPWEPIPRSAWPAIAAQCGPTERDEVETRLAALRTERASVEEWDGDTQDDISSAIQFFEELRLLIR